MPSERLAPPRAIAVPSHDAAAHLLLAIHVTRLVFGRSREPGVEVWLSSLREALTAVLSPTELDAVLARCRTLERDLERAA